MGNPILGAVNQSRIAPIKNMMQMLKSGGNPQVMLQQIMNNNPQLMNILRQNGGDPQKAFYAVANQLGVNGDEILSMLK